MELIRPLGEGSFGKVYLANWNETLVALKVLIDKAGLASSGGGGIDSLSSQVLTDLAKEAALMASLRHPNIVQFMGVCTSPPCVATEFCTRGSLFDLLRDGAASSEKAAELTWTRRLTMAMDAAQGILYLHRRSPPIIHRDIKTPNLLVGQNWEVKVADFNLSKLVEEATHNSIASAGGAMNPRWLAPEILEGRSGTAVADVFSFGVVMWELLTWQLPWTDTNPWQIVNNVSRGERPALPDVDGLPGMDPQPPVARLNAYIALMNRCWTQNPNSRPAPQEIVQKLRDLIKLRGSAPEHKYGPWRM